MAHSAVAPVGRQQLLHQRKDRKDNNRKEGRQAGRQVGWVRHGNKPPHHNDNRETGSFEPLKKQERVAECLSTQCRPCFYWIHALSPTWLASWGRRTGISLLIKPQSSRGWLLLHVD